MKRKKDITGDGETRARLRRSQHLGPWLSLGLAILVVFAALVVLGLSGRSVPLPSIAVEAIEKRANRLLEGQASLFVAHGDLVVTSGFVPQIRLTDVTVRGKHGERLANVHDLRASFSGRALMSGDVIPVSLTAQGARISVQRRADGSLNLSPDAGHVQAPASLNPAAFLDQFDTAFANPALAQISAINVTGLALLFDDQRAGQVWTVSDGTLQIAQDNAEIHLDLGFEVAGQSSTLLNRASGEDADSGRLPAPPARAFVQFKLATEKANSAARLAADLTGISARDLAAQVPALAWLAPLDAPISGQVQSGFDPKGGLLPLVVALDVGPGALKPTKDTRAIAFEHANLGLTYDASRAALRLTRLSVASQALAAEATGQAWLKGMEDGVPEALVAQIALSDLRADPEGLFSRPVTIGQGSMDLKMDLDPFRLKIGQLTLVDQGQKISGKGTIDALEKGWAVALDVAIDAIETRRLLALWPMNAVPKTRQWLSDNVATGELFDVKGAFRAEPGKDPRFALGYQFRGAEVRFMKTLPPIVDGAGYATISDNAYVLVAEKGFVKAPQGGVLDIGGSVLKVPDMRLKPAPMEITLHSKSSITAALSILDQKPFEFLSKAGMPVNLADGQVEVTSLLKFTPKAKLMPSDVTYQVDGTLKEVSSGVLVKNHRLSSDHLKVVASNSGLEISGDAQLDDLPLSGSWTQKFSPESKGKSHIDGKLLINDRSLRALAVTLPQGAVSGAAEGHFDIDLVRGETPNFRLTSDLVGAGLTIPEVGWAKPESQKAELTVSGRLGAPAAIDKFDLKAAGLSAEGKIVLKPEGGLDRADFKAVKLSDWFVGDVGLIGRGKGKTVGLEVTSGEADMRKATLGPGTGAGDGDAPPITIGLDRLQVSDDIALTQFKGDFSTRGGFSGDFAGLVNGTAAVVGTLVPAGDGRSAFRVESANAGAALSAAKLYSSGRGGQLKVILQPKGPKGTYEGTLSISHIRVVNAPELASLLNAISVVGLINELQGSGIAFSDVAGDFLLTPQAVEIQKGSAIGASLGVSAAGVYRTGDKHLDIQGVISPVYLLNGIGQIFSKTRDGLFGFNYTLQGSPDRLSVSVNPLSILTPGLLRDLFRKKAPVIAP